MIAAVQLLQQRVVDFPEVPSAAPEGFGCSVSHTIASKSTDPPAMVRPVGLSDAKANVHTGASTTSLSRSSVVRAGETCLPAAW